MRETSTDLPGVMDLLDVGVGVFDAALDLTYANKSFRDLRGYPDALCQPGAKLIDLLAHSAGRGDFGPGDADELTHARMAEIENATDREVEHIRPDGQVLRIRYQRLDDGGLIITYQDRTAERQAEDASRRSERRYALVAQATSDGIYDWNVTDDVLYVSEHLTEFLDFDMNNGPSSRWLERIHPDDQGPYMDALRAHFADQSDAIERDYRVRTRGGGYRWVHDRGVGVRDADGRVTRLVGAVRDITEARGSARELEETRGRLFSSLSSISDGILITDADNCVELFNDRYVEMFQEASGEIDMRTIIYDGRPFVEVVRDTYQLGVFRPHPDGVDAFIANRLKAWETDAAEWELQLANGTWLLLKERKMPDGSRISVYTEITDLKRREAEAAAAGERLTTSLASLSDGILIVDAEHRVETYNPRYVQIFSDACGQDAAPIVQSGRPFFDMLRDGYSMGMFKPYPGGVDVWITDRMATWDKPASQLEVELANGSWVLINDREMPDGGRISIYTDITDIKQREAETNAARQRFEEAIEAISSGFVLWDAEDRLLISNARYRAYFSELEDMVVPGTAFNDIIAAGIKRGMFPLAEGDVQGYLDEIAAKRKDAAGEVREQFINGYWLQITDHRTADGGIVSIYSDITELKAQQDEIAHQTALLELTMENMGQGISLVDKDLRTTAFNTQFLELMDFPPDKFARGFTMEQAFRFNAERGEYGPGDIEEQVAARLELAGKFQAHQFQREKPDGTVLEITGIPIEGGGMVSTYTDITERRRAEDALNVALEEFNAVSEHIDYGILFTGPDLRARIVNKAFRDLWGLSQKFIDSNPTMREIIEVNRHTGLYTVPDAEFDDWLDSRIASIEAGDVPPVEMVRGDGKILSYQVVSLPGGGRMMTYFDISELKNRELEASRARDAAEAALDDLQKAQERLVQSEKMASLGLTCPQNFGPFKKRVCSRNVQSYEENEECGSHASQRNKSSGFCRSMLRVPKCLSFAASMGCPMRRCTSGKPSMAA